MSAPEAPVHSVNVPLLRTVLTVATRHPEKHNQEDYARRRSCGTAYCLAGMTAVVTRQRLRWRRGNAGMVTGGTTIDEYAAQALGLPLSLVEQQMQHKRDDVRHLFAPNNTIRECWEIASELTGGEIEVPADLSGGGS